VASYVRNLSATFVFCCISKRGYSGSALPVLLFAVSLFLVSPWKSSASSL
jgi:hypothetical protein